MKQAQRILIVLLLLTTSVAKGQVGIGTGTPDPSSQLDVVSTSKGFLPPRMTTVQRNLIPSPDEGLIIYNTTIKAFECYNGAAWYSTVHYIGESYGGGIVFYVYDNGQHGLIAATADNGTTVKWSNGIYRITGSTGDGIITGADNTALIIATQLADNPTGNFAAKSCAAYSVTAGGQTYSDWYLPSKHELMLLINQQFVVGGISTAVKTYSSSTEFNDVSIWTEESITGTISNTSKSTILYIRAVRAF